MRHLSLLLNATSNGFSLDAPARAHCAQNKCKKHGRRFPVDSIVTQYSYVAWKAYLAKHNQYINPAGPDLRNTRNTKLLSCKMFNTLNLGPEQLFV